ncbi:trehalase family glycosidase [Flavobacterium sp. CS20]|uniref:trehalase family glycosidase n=1 Tax=Flavobacterium sp. CS20 TaxID=2775246 RepID=UPI001B39EC66|nr:trehalase family glycosidase [Flavobacterium sp. CS20]QTY26383.1 trehalase [Flavobacterium sp. CS20]
MQNRFQILILVFLFMSCQDKTTLDILKVNVKQTLSSLEQDEDTDRDKKITKEDTGDKSYTIKTIDGQKVLIESTYYLSNLLQELATAKNKGQDIVEIPLSRIKEKPAERLSRLIKTRYWNNLTRRVDKSGLERILTDSKASDSLIRRLYVPATDSIGIDYFKNIESEFERFKVVVLPQNISPEYVKSINDKPGILSLKIKDNKGVPFVVPGGRFNEMYGWDSYFESVGLNLDGRQDLSKAMIENFAYEIKHYGKILNANRDYYLTRSQPPFMTSFIRETYESTNEKDSLWLKEMTRATMQEYFEVWMEKGKKLTQNGLNRYYAEGIGIPPETEPGHFDEQLEMYAEKYDMSLKEFTEAYQNGNLPARENLKTDLNLPSLDEYFLHDRSLRESGHDTTWRLDGVCADLNTVALNSLLYKYETDFAYLIKTYFNNSFTYGNQTFEAKYWLDKAKDRKQLVNELLWNEKDKVFYDYNFETQEPLVYESATNYYPLWAKLATKEQAEHLKNSLLKTLKARCGILASSKASVERYATSDVARQWDYPNGWAPHQMLMWKGLMNYGYDEEAQELIYRWLWLITKNLADYNGTIPEKYDVVNCTHKVYAEYGNVGTKFNYITPSGFGWMNASYQYGLHLLKADLRDKLNDLVEPEILF